MNNAGICVVGPVECVPLGDWRRQFEVNILGAIAVTQAMLPLLRAHSKNSGHTTSRIVNIGSITGEVSTPVFGAYSTSKFALRGMTDALRLEVRADRIRVCLIVPGTIQSDIWQKEKEGIGAIAARPGVRQLYGTLIDNVAASVFRHAEGALPAERVAEVVERCLTSPRPRGQYRVGWEAEVGWRAKRFIPDWLFGILLARSLKVPGESSRHRRQREPPVLRAPGAYDSSNGAIADLPEGSI